MVGLDMKYQKKKFSVGATTESVANWDATFADEDATEPDALPDGLGGYCDLPGHCKHPFDVDCVFSPAMTQKMYNSLPKEKAETPVKESRPRCPACSSTTDDSWYCSWCATS